MEPAERTPGQILASAQSDLQTAVSVGDPHGRQQYARSARDSAVDVILNPTATAQQKAAARQCAAIAQTMTGELSAWQRRARAAADRRDQSAGVEID